MDPSVIDLNQEEGEPEAPPVQDVHAPIDPLDIRLNFNCMLYLFTELMALNNELMVVLLERGDLTQEEVTRIYQVTADKDALVKIYQPVFARFMDYYVATKRDVTGEEPQAVGPNFGARNENFPGDENPTVVSSATTITQEEVDNS